MIARVMHSRVVHTHVFDTQFRYLNSTNKYANNKTTKMWSHSSTVTASHNQKLHQFTFIHETILDIEALDSISELKGVTTYTLLLNYLLV